MTRAKSGDRVSIDYMLRTADGELVDIIAARPTIRFTVGSGEVIAGLDQAVVGMGVGESKTVVAPPALGHGPHRPERVMHFKRAAVPYVVKAPVAHGNVGLFTTTESADAVVTEDYNHPLAGKDLTFEITLVSIESAVG